MKTMKDEPVVITFSLVALFNAVVNLAIAFGWSISAEQHAAVTTLVGLISIPLAGLFARSKVTPIEGAKGEGE